MTCKNPCPPSLRHKVTLRRETHADDGAGGTVVSWVDVAQLWTHIQQLRAGEKWHAQKLESQSTHKMTVRYFAGMKTTDQIVYRGVEYNIDGIDNIDLMNQWHVVKMHAGVVQ